MVTHDVVQNLQNLSEKTPQDNIGVSATVAKRVKRQPQLEFRVDWLQGTFPSRYLAKVHRFVSLVFGKGEFEERSFGIRYFARSYRHPSGAVSGVGHKIPGGLIDETLAYLELSGDVVERIKQSKLRKLMRVLCSKCGFQCTRDDLTVDDYGKSFDISQVKLAADNFHYVGFRNTVEYRQLGRNGSLGEQISFGRRGSSGGGKRLLFYNKSLESGGKVDSHRIELSCYDHYAEQSCKQLCDLPYLCWGDLIGGWISGAIDFRKRQGENDKNPGRRRRLGWWARLVKNFPQLKPSRDYKPGSLDKLKAWFVKQVAPSVAVFIHAMYDPSLEDPFVDFWDFFWSSVDDGESRFRDKHHYLINSC